MVNVFKITFSNLRIAAALSIFCAGIALPSYAQTDMNVRLMAATCQSCHGKEGRAQGVGLRLSGQSEEELERKLLGYRSGQIKGTVMHQHAKGYTEAELKALARHFAQFK